MTELPFQTYERIIGKKWPGGRSIQVRTLLALAGITNLEPGTAEANLSLQAFLFAVDTLRDPIAAAAFLHMKVTA